MLYDLIARNGMTIHQCSERAGVPYTTLRQLAYAKSSVLKCNALTLYRLSKALGVTMDDLLAPYIRWEVGDTSWENFKSTVQHMLNGMGDKAFIKDVVKNMVPFYYCMKKEMKECLYLVAMTDYLCRENGIKPFDGFEVFRKVRFDNPIYPADVSMAKALGLTINKKVEEDAIPEFRRHNIIEGGVRNAC